jgi:hypothetical protein
LGIEDISFVYFLGIDNFISSSLYKNFDIGFVMLEDNLNYSGGQIIEEGRMKEIYLFIYFGAAG